MLKIYKIINRISIVQGKETVCMGLLSGIFKKKSCAPEFTKRSDVKRKKLSFNYVDIETLDQKMKSDTSVIESLSPTNYYASKFKYIQAVLFYLPDYSYIMVKLDSYIDDKIERSTDYFEISFNTMQKLCNKFGQHL